MRVMHCVAVELSAMFGWMFATSWKPTTIALAKIIVMIDMSVEMFWPVEPGSRPDKYAACEPLRAIKAIRSAVVRGNLIVPVRTNRRRPNRERNLSGRIMGGSHQEPSSNSYETQISQRFHISTLRRQ